MRTDISSSLLFIFLKYYYPKETVEVFNKLSKDNRINLWTENVRFDQQDLFMELYSDYGIALQMLKKYYSV